MAKARLTKAEQQVLTARQSAKRYGRKSTLTLGEWEAILKASGGKCFYCSTKCNRDGVRSADELTMDHILPFLRGGNNTVHNVTVACRSCNQKKKHRTPAEFLAGKSSPKGSIQWVTHPRLPMVTPKASHVERLANKGN